MNLLVWGKTGRMSRMLINMAKEDPFWHKVQGISSHEDEESWSIKPDVVVDFSHPSALDRLLEFCIKRKCPLVIGTTGYSDEQMAQIKEASKTIPLVHSANMSLGMNLLFSLVRDAAVILKDSVDIEVVEYHHNRKKDAPSGSALSIVDAIEAGLGEKRKKVYGRVGESLRQKGEIGMHSIRGGNMIGRHEAWFIQELESITLVHEANDRSVFAKGSLEAAKFASKAAPGLYDMTDVLGLDQKCTV
jgi:4-hydroxy-tetrahydrodipicolinate reductase